MRATRYHRRHSCCSTHTLDATHVRATSICLRRTCMCDAYKHRIDTRASALCMPWLACAHTLQPVRACINMRTCMMTSPSTHCTDSHELRSKTTIRPKHWYSSPRTREPCPVFGKAGGLGNDMILNLQSRILGSGIRGVVVVRHVGGVGIRVGPFGNEFGRAHHQVENRWARLAPLRRATLLTRTDAQNKHTRLRLDATRCSMSNAIIAALQAQ